MTDMKPPWISWRAVACFAATLSATSLANGHESPVAVSPGIGTDHPISLLAASPHGDWLVIRQARDETQPAESGDNLQGYLVEGVGPGRPIGDYLGASEDGRWLLSRTAHGHALRDMQTGAAHSLSVSPHWSTVGALTRRPALFVSGQRLLYAGTRNGRTRIIVRQLETGQERAFAGDA